MFNALAIAATGMQAQQLNVDTIAANMVNANTPAYKKGRVQFSELMAKAAGRPEAAPIDSSVQVSLGVDSSVVAKSFDAGEIRQTESPMDLAIQGEGWLELAMPDGTRAYTRGGPLRITADGQLATASGVTFKPGITVPDNASAITIASDGRVQVRVPGQSNPIDAGQLELVRFSNPQGLLAQAGNLYRATDASGEPIGGRAGEDGLGTLAQGHLEGSNVKLVDETMGLMLAQRSYQASVEVARAADEMLGLINGLRR